eukprot:6473067-Amphidinium_carterae.1
MITRTCTSRSGLPMYRMRMICCGMQQQEGDQDANQRAAFISNCYTPSREAQHRSSNVKALTGCLSGT